MIRIVATFHVRPDAVEEFRALAGELVEGSRAEEGNIAYDLCVARDDRRARGVARRRRDRVPQRLGALHDPGAPDGGPLRRATVSGPVHRGLSTGSGDRQPYQPQAVMRHREVLPSESMSSSPSVGTWVRLASHRRGAAPVTEPEAVASELL